MNEVAPKAQRNEIPRMLDCLSEAVQCNRDLIDKLCAVSEVITESIPPSDEKTACTPASTKYGSLIAAEVDRVRTSNGILSSLLSRIQL